MDTKTLSNITLCVSSTNMACMTFSFFTSIGQWSFCIAIGVSIVIAHSVVIFMLSKDLKMLEGTTNKYVLNSIDNSLRWNKILLAANMIAFIVFPCIWLNLILSA